MKIFLLCIWRVSSNSPVIFRGRLVERSGRVVPRSALDGWRCNAYVTRIVIDRDKEDADRLHWGSPTRCDRKDRKDVTDAP